MYDLSVVPEFDSEAFGFAMKGAEGENDSCYF